ncbi:MAG TPA: hypothetical protein VFF33_13500 [Ignavibacteriaceae bacterium]|nr:hypothetical protein [Ignavibacteriaceae bacterium]
MKILILKIILIIILILFFSSCKENFVSPTVNNQLPFTDTIPYDFLGEGKICFDRIGPMDNYRCIFVIDLDNKKSWNISMLEDAPSISPDGNRIAFSTFAGVDSWDIYIFDSDGSNSHRISSYYGMEQCPTWFPDNQNLIYYSSSFIHNEITPVFTYNLQTKTAVKIIDFGKLNYPTECFPIDKISVSSKNKCIVCTSLGICTFNLDGSNLKFILSGKETYFNYHSPVWNPNGDKFAIVKKDFSKFDILIFNEDGTNSTIIYSGLEENDGTYWSGSNDVSLCWSPDGKKLLFNKKEGHLTSHIYVINSDGSGLCKVTTEIGTTNRSISWGK